MFCRLSADEILPDAEDDVLAAAEDMRAEIRAIPGVAAIHSVGLAEGRCRPIASDESRDAMEAAAGESREIFGRPAPHLKLDTLEQRSGEATWQI